MISFGAMAHDTQACPSIACLHESVAEYRHVVLGVKQRLPP